MGLPVKSQPSCFALLFHIPAGLLTAARQGATPRLEPLMKLRLEIP